MCLHMFFGLLVHSARRRRRYCGGLGEARSRLERCLGGQDNKQIGARLLKYIQERPGGQREGVHVILYRQMIEVCPGAGPAQ